MDIRLSEDKLLKNLTKINVLLGKNGCGKSTILKEIDARLNSDSSQRGKIKYITPERSGILQYDANVEQNINNNLDWLPSSRRVNQFERFKNQTVSQYRDLQLMVLREIAKHRRDDKEYTFDLYLRRINNLLDHVEFRDKGNTFEIYKKGTDNKIDARNISSGESELICLAIECLVFERECVEGKVNILLLDEPDVHLHPDLQLRFINLIKEGVEKGNHIVIMATHSTAILGALEDYPHFNVAFMQTGMKEFNFKEVSSIYKRMLPIFGAHPLSNLFNEAPILLLEGEDDERVWQRAVRVSQGKIKAYPCSKEGLGSMNDLELAIKEVTSAVYDTPRAYSLRDRDDGSDEIADLPPIVRFKLSCRSVENLLLSDEVLASLEISWVELKVLIEEWLSKNIKHKNFGVMLSFKEQGYDRKNYNIKKIRNDLMGIIGSNLDWEIAIGKVIGKLSYKESVDFSMDGSIFNFLGKKLVQNIIPKL